MAKRASLEDRLEVVRSTRADPSTAEARSTLTQALADRSGLVVAAAAEVIAETEAEGFGPAMTAAFDRLLAAGDSADPQCRGKTALVRALVQTNHDDCNVY